MSSRVDKSKFIVRYNSVIRLTRSYYKICTQSTIHLSISKLNIKKKTLHLVQGQVELAYQHWGLWPSFYLTIFLMPMVWHIFRLLAIRFEQWIFMLSLGFAAFLNQIIIRTYFQEHCGLPLIYYSVNIAYRNDNFIKNP